MKRIIVFILVMLLIVGCTTNIRYKTKAKSQPSQMGNNFKMETRGKIFHYRTSYYAKKFQGKITASGEKYNMYDLTCAHKNFPFGTKLLVTNEDNGKSVIVRVNDRGPWKTGRDLDISYAAAKKIGLIKSGTKVLKVKVLN